jgi:hypothetical protein
MLDKVIDAARAAGAAGETWYQFQVDDALQRWIDEVGRDGYDSGIRHIEAAFEAGAAEQRKLNGWVERFTTAPADYDTFGTLHLRDAGDWNGKALRVVIIDPVHLNFQEMRYGSGLHGSWVEDPREVERARKEAFTRRIAEQKADEERRSSGLKWLRTATEDEIRDAHTVDELNPRGLQWSDAKAELERRKQEIEDLDRERRLARCREIVKDGMNIVEPRREPQRVDDILGGYVTKRRESRVYYSIRIGYGNDPEEIQVSADGGEGPGTLADVARAIDSGEYQIGGDDLPPRPVLDRIGHSRLRDVTSHCIADQTVWVGAAIFASPMVLNEKGHKVRKKSVVDGALSAHWKVSS